MSRQNKLILKQIGLHYPTMVELNGKILATQGLDMETLCSMWRQYFGTAIPFGRVDLYVEKERDFNAIQQKTLASSKSVMELFAEQGFCCVLLPKDEEKGDWKICSTRELAQKDDEIEELKSALVGVKKEREELKERAEKAEAERDELSQRLKKAVFAPYIPDKVDFGATYAIHNVYDNTAELRTSIHTYKKMDTMENALAQIKIIEDGENGDVE